MANLRAKDFQRIAATMADLQSAILARVPVESIPQIGQSFYNAMSDLALVLSEHNGKFDRSRFLAACMPKGD
jgi:hypothetical protein